MPKPLKSHSQWSLGGVNPSEPGVTCISRLIEYIERTSHLILTWQFWLGVKSRYFPILYHPAFHPLTLLWHFFFFFSGKVVSNFFYKKRNDTKLTKKKKKKPPTTIFVLSSFLIQGFEFESEIRIICIENRLYRLTFFLSNSSGSKDLMDGYDRNWWVPLPVSWSLDRPWSTPILNHRLNGPHLLICVRLKLCGSYLQHHNPIFCSTSGLKKCLNLDCGRYGMCQCTIARPSKTIALINVIRDPALSVCGWTKFYISESSRVSPDDTYLKPRSKPVSLRVQDDESRLDMLNKVGVSSSCWRR